MQSVCPLRVFESVRPATSQILISPPRCGSPPAAASRLPSGVQARLRTRSAWPLSEAKTFPLAGSSSSTSWYPPTASIFPSGEKVLASLKGHRSEEHTSELQSPVHLV